MRSLLAFALLAAPAFASAERAERFGDAGTVSPSGGMVFAYSTYEGSSVVRVEVRPGVNYFVADGWAVGGGIGASYFRFPGSAGTAAALTLSITPEVSYNYWLRDGLSLLGYAGVGFSRDSSRVGSRVGSGTTVTSYNLGLFVAAQLLVHFDNFFIGAGPSFYASKESVNGLIFPIYTNVGIATMTGGWF